MARGTSFASQASRDMIKQKKRRQNKSPQSFATDSSLEDLELMDVVEIYEMNELYIERERNQNAGKQVVVELKNVPKAITDAQLNLLKSFETPAMQYDKQDEDIPEESSDVSKGRTEHSSQHSSDNENEDSFFYNENNEITQKSKRIRKITTQIAVKPNRPENVMQFQIDMFNSNQILDVVQHVVDEAEVDNDHEIEKKHKSSRIGSGISIPDEKQPSGLDASCRSKFSGHSRASGI